MSIQKLVEEYNRTAEAPYVKLTPEIAEFLKKLAHDNGVPGSDVELLANHTLHQARLQHAIYEERVLARLAGEEARGVNSQPHATTPAPEPDPETEDLKTAAGEEPQSRTGIPELDGFIAEIEKLGGTVIGGFGGGAPSGLGTAGLGMLAQMVGGKDGLLTEIYGNLGVKKKGPCPGCGGNH